MKHNFTTQSQACKDAKEAMKFYGWDDNMLSKLECAAQTLASLNWTKDLVDKGREEYWENMYESFDVFVAGTIDQESQEKEKLLSMSYDKLAAASRRIEELEEVLKETLHNELPQGLFERIESLLKQQEK